MPVEENFISYQAAFTADNKKQQNKETMTIADQFEI